VCDIEVDDQGNAGVNFGRSSMRTGWVLSPRSRFWRPMPSAAPTCYPAETPPASQRSARLAWPTQGMLGGGGERLIHQFRWNNRVYIFHDMFRLPVEVCLAGHGKAGGTPCVCMIHHISEHASLTTCMSAAALHPLCGCLC